MSLVKKYVESLLLLNNINVSSHQHAFFNTFLTDAAILDAYQQVKKNQSFILESWKERSITEEIRQKHIPLPNATVGKIYRYVFDLAKLGLQDIGSFEWTMDDALGISFDTATNTFTGTPQQQGEHLLTLHYKLKDSSEDKPFFVKELRLIVNPDPKSLWQNLPSDEQDEYWRPDNISAHTSFGDKKLIIGSKRGRSHAHEGRFRDDAFAYSYATTSGWGLIAVADGAGSAKYSRKGAAIACDAVHEFFDILLTSDKIQEIETAVNAYTSQASEALQKQLSSLFIDQLGKAAFFAQSKIKEEAQRKEADIKDYATTLIFTMTRKFAAGYVICSFWVGDGGIGIFDNTKPEVVVLGTPDSGEFAGQTRFLTMPDIFADSSYANRIRFKIVPDFTALVLMTDGITDPKFQTDANLSKTAMWQELWADLGGKNADNCKIDFAAAPETAAAMLMNWLDFWSPGNHDDRTIAILY